MNFNETGENTPADVSEHEESDWEKEEAGHERSLSACLGTLAQQVKEMERRVSQEGVAVASGELTDLLSVIAEAKDLALKEEDNARRDVLTGLPNRRAFDEAMEIEMSRFGRARRQGEDKEGFLSLHVVKIDLDFFKNINDSFGHAVGDLYLQKVSGEIRRVLRATDTVARVGGDEFAVLLPGMNPAYAETMKERLLEAVHEGSRKARAELLRRRPHIKLEETGGNVSASMGFARFSGVETPENFLDRADYASYVAKAAGKDAVVDEAMLAEFDPDGEIRDAFMAEKEGQKWADSEVIRSS